MEKLKQLIIETLDKICKADLPYVIKDLKAKAMIKLIDGSISREQADLIIETCEEYVANNEKS